MIIGNVTQQKKFAYLFPVELLNHNLSEIDSIRNVGEAFHPGFFLFQKHIC